MIILTLTLHSGATCENAERNVAAVAVVAKLAVEAAVAAVAAVDAVFNLLHHLQSRNFVPWPML